MIEAVDYKPLIPGIDAFKGEILAEFARAATSAALMGTRDGL